MIALIGAEDLVLILAIVVYGAAQLVGRRPELAPAEVRTHAPSHPLPAEFARPAVPPGLRDTRAQPALIRPAYRRNR